MKRIALVTGGNRGLGREVVRELAHDQHMTVMLAARNSEQGRAQVALFVDEGLDVEFLKLDVTSEEDIRHAVLHIEKMYGHLDVLVNNAGIQQDSKKWACNTSATITPDHLRSTFDTNFFGLVNLTNALLPLLKKSPAGRIVNVSSILGSMSMHSKPGSPVYDTKTFAYNASKTALNSYTVHLAHALLDSNVHVNSAHPGWVKTDMGTQAAPMSVEEGAKTIVALTAEDAPNGQFVHMGRQLPW